MRPKLKGAALTVNESRITSKLKHGLPTMDEFATECRITRNLNYMTFHIV